MWPTVIVVKHSKEHNLDGQMAYIKRNILPLSLRDPGLSERLLAITLLQKGQVLLDNLLVNAAEVGDISMNTLKFSLCSLSFP